MFLNVLTKLVSFYEISKLSKRHILCVSSIGSELT